MSLHQRILLGLFIFCALSAVGITFSGWRVNWLWARWPFMGLALILGAFLAARFWLDAERRRQARQLDAVRREAGVQFQRAQLFNRLSAREREILDRLLAGKSNREIAAELHIALSTVKTHINHIYKALEVKERGEIARRLGQEED